MAAGKEDRRPQRTRLMLRTALISLIREKGFEALTVQDIIDRANVGRSTFYSHFRSKEDLLAGGVEMLRSSLGKVRLRSAAGKVKPEDRLFAFSRELFNHAEEHREVFAAMVGKRSGTVFQHHLKRVLADLVREDLSMVGSRRKREPMQTEAVVQFVTGGLLGLLAAWLERMPGVCAADLDLRFRRMAITAAEAVLC
jgi:AcrR family transcriptional regulator